MAELLMTGFEGFLGRERNPAWDGLAAMRERDPSQFEAQQPLALAKIPVRYGAATRALAEAIQAARPRAIVMFGMHGGQESAGRGLTTFYVERRAYNLDDSPAPDNAGETRRGRPIVEDAGLSHLEATLPSDWILDRLSRSGESWEESSDAGRYLCNHLFFGALRLASSIKPSPLVAFVHVPPSEEIREGAMPTHRFANAYAAIADAILERLRAGAGVPALERM